MIKSLTISQLAKRCQAEVERYKQIGRSDEAYCLELFYRALTEQNEAAWQSIYVQYQTLVTNWVRNYSRFPHPFEETDFFVNEAFARLWRFGSKSETAAKLNSLGKCLSFLKLCVGSAIEDYLRKVEKDVLKKAIRPDNYDRTLVATEDQKEYALPLSELRQALEETVQNNKERLVAEESWVYGFAPRKIQTRHSETFATTGEVNQIKRNLIKRLQRRLNRKFGTND